MNHQHELHIKKLSAENLLPIIRHSEFAELAGLIEEFNITGEDLLILKEYDFMLKYGSNVNRRLVTRLLDSVQNRPQELFPLQPAVKRKPSFVGGSKPSLNRAQSIQLISGELARKFSLKQSQSNDQCESEIGVGDVARPLPARTRPPPPPRPQTKETINVFRESDQLDLSTSKETKSSHDIGQGEVRPEPERHFKSTLDDWDYSLVYDREEDQSTPGHSGANREPPAILPKPFCVPPKTGSCNVDQCDQPGSLLSESAGSFESCSDLNIPEKPTDTENRLDLDDVINQFNDVLKLIDFSKTEELIQTLPVATIASTIEKEAKTPDSNITTNEEQPTPSNRDHLMLPGRSHKESAPRTVVKKTKIKDISHAGAKLFEESQPGMTVAEPTPSEHIYGTLPSAMNAVPGIPSEAFLVEDDYVWIISPQSIAKENKYYRDYDKATCRNILANKPAGTFLIRSSDHYVCVLVVKGQDKIKNIPMKYDFNERKFYLVAVRGQVNHDRFDALNDLVEYYMEHEIDGELLLKPQFNILE